MRVTKQLFLVGLILLLYSSALSQNNKVSTDENNLYRMALSASLDKMSESWGNIDDTVLDSRIRTDYRNMIVEKNSELTKNLPAQFGERRVEYLDSQGLIDRYKKMRKSFSILVIHPMENEGASLKISITVHWFSYKKRVLYYEISDWSNVKFRFDCEKSEFVIDEVKLGGI